MVSIALLDPNKPESSIQNRISKISYLISTYLGRGKRLFSAVFILSILSYFVVGSKELLLLLLFWGLVLIIEPLQLSALLEKLRSIFTRKAKNKVGDVLYVRNPNIIIGTIKDGARLGEGELLSISLKDKQKKNGNSYTKKQCNSHTR